MVDKAQRFKIGVHLVVISISLYQLSQRNYLENETPFFQKLLMNALSPVQQILGNMQDGVEDLVNHYLLNVNAKRQNEELNKLVASLKDEIFQFRELQSENMRLKKLLNFTSEGSYTKILAQVVAWDSQSDFRMLRINKGYSDGLRLQQPVVNAMGVVGYIYRLSDHYADVLTILDSNNRVDGIVRRTRSHGIVEGHHNRTCQMKYVSSSEPIIIGDFVLTSGLGNIYPKGLRIGTVTQIRRKSYSMTQAIEITPSVHFSQLEEVIVLAMDQQQEFKEEWEALSTSGDKK